MKKALLIINPSAGKNQAKSSLFDIIQIFNRAQYAVTTVVTEYKGHASMMAQRAKNWDLIVCLGGDGTLNEVISGLMKGGSKIPLGYIPAGSTNDFASSLGLSKDVRTAAKNIVTGAPRPIDVGKFGDRYFTYVASFGAFTKASYATTREAKKALGHAAYVLEGVREIPEIRFETLSIETPEGKFEGDYIWGAVGNTTSVAGVVTLPSEYVKLDDGKLDLLLVKNPLSISELNDCIFSILSQDYDSDLIDFVSTESATITADPQMDWTLDGEKHEGRRKIEVKCLKHAVTLYY